jgi:segregation and condensation protein B
MSLKAQLEAIIYAAETPITLEQMLDLVKESVIAASAADEAEAKSRVRSSLEELIGEYGGPDHGIEIRQVAGGYRMSTKPEQHEVVRAFAKSLKPPIRLSLPALETLAVIAYKQPVTVPEISDIRGVDSGGVIGTLLDRKLITTAGRKQVIGRPILYKTTKEFLMRFGLKDVSELPSMEEFEKLVAESFQAELIPAETAAAESANVSVATDSPRASDGVSDGFSDNDAADDDHAVSQRASATEDPEAAEPREIEKSAAEHRD